MNGARIRELRRLCKLTQEEFAHESGLSVRLISKAEAGGPLDAWSLRAIVRVLDRAERPICPQDLTLPMDANGDRGPFAVVLLNQFLHGLWQPNWRETVEQFADENIVFHCEQGSLVGRAALATRTERFREVFVAGEISVLEQSGGATRAAARWRLKTPDANHAPAEGGERHGLTSIVVAEARIVQAWEFWAPEPARSVLAVATGESR